MPFLEQGYKPMGHRSRGSESSTQEKPLPKRVKTTHQKRPVKPNSTIQKSRPEVPSLSKDFICTKIPARLNLL
jgi:hypothetical protein